MASLNGLTVVSFESRMAKKMGKLIEQEGGVPLLAPSMKEMPLEENPAAFEFFRRLEAGEIDLTILMTGVGTRTLFQTLATRYPHEQIVTALATKTKICVRGPKPTAACKTLGIPIALTVPEPNTWHEILALLDEEVHLAHARVAVQEYGIPNGLFTEELLRRGAKVFSFPVYQWALPDDLAPLTGAIDQITAGRVDLALFTNAAQVVHLLRLTMERNQESELRRAFHRIGIVSIGPTTSEQLRAAQLFPDLEVHPHKMDHLVEEAAVKGNEIIARKRARTDKAWVRIMPPSFFVPSPLTGEGQGGGATTPSPQPSPARGEGEIMYENPITRACRREPNETVPIWFMRQAGRYMAEYQMIRQKVRFLELCKSPDLASQVTIDAVERLGVDAAIIFADILLILEPMGVELDFEKGLGPNIRSPIRSVEDIEKLKSVDPSRSLPFVLEAIQKTRSAMHPRIPLIGFAGAPFTLASYLIEGQSSKNFIPTKTFMHEEPAAWHRLLEKLSNNLIAYLNAQIAAGCELVQIFDSWVGCLSPADYREYALAHTQKLISGIQKGVPVIHFGTGTGTLLELQKEAGGDVIGVDWRVPIGQAWERLGPDAGIQGNLDPVILFSKTGVIYREAKKILDAVGNRPGFIFNLGHGILPETPVDHVMALVDYVHEWR